MIAAPGNTSRYGAHAAAEHRDERIREEDVGDPQHDVDEPHDERIRPPPEPSGNRADRHADDRFEERGEQPDEQAEANAVHHVREHVASAPIDAEWMLIGRRFQEDSLGVRGRILHQEGANDGHEDEEHDDPESDHREPVSTESAPCILRQRAADAGLSERGVGIGKIRAERHRVDGHLAPPFRRIRGSSQA